MIQTKLKGMGVALITPFKEDESVGNSGGGSDGDQGENPLG